MLIDRLLYKRPDRPDKRVTGFVQAGIGDYRVNRLGRYLGAGLTLVEGSAYRRFLKRCQLI